jgi:hypothetical protein
MILAIFYYTSGNWPLLTSIVNGLLLNPTFTASTDSIINSPSLPGTHSMTANVAEWLTDALSS